MPRFVGCDCLFLLVAVSVTLLMMVPGIAAKQLILIAGPRQEGIQEFFYQHATTDSEESIARSESLQDWSWPTLRDEGYDLVLRESSAETKVSRQNIFTLFFEEKGNSVVQQVLMEAIRESWDNSVKGIILGDERLGNVGVEQYTSEDPLKIIVRVMENLSITAKDVTLVLLYGTPRVQQWASLWHRESRYETYHNFLCRGDEDNDRRKHLDTTMNPFKVSKIYREHGWNVVVVDEEGVRSSGFDPAHAISCDILDVNCENGWIAGLKTEPSRDLPSFEINDLDENQKEELEQLFLLRDCFYEQDLQSGTNKFKIVSQELIWESCRNHYEPEVREMIDDVDFFLDAIQSQQGCESDTVDLSDVLASANSTSFATLLWLMIFASIFCVAGASGFLFVRFARENKIKIEFDGIFRYPFLWKNEPTNPKPPDSTDHGKSLCNACKFVRFDTNCIYCGSDELTKSSEIGIEIERRIKQERKLNCFGAIDQTKGSNQPDPQAPLSASSYSDNPTDLIVGKIPLSTNDIVESSNSLNLDHMWPTDGMAFGNLKSDNCVDTSHFDLNLRKTRDQNKNRRKKKEKEKKSHVVNKLTELMVLRTEDGRRVYSIGELSSSNSDDNLQTIHFGQEEKVHYYV